MLCFSSGKKTCNSGSPTVNVSADLKWTNKSNNKNVKTSKQNSLTLTAKSTSLSLKPKRLKKKLIKSESVQNLNLMQPRKLKNESSNRKLLKLRWH